MHLLTKIGLKNKTQCVWQETTTLSEVSREIVTRGQIFNISF